ncbi:hypothetical protein BCON_0649g00020 [Botryotinia convoluta]|uniref:Rhodopsin domain-containing protein n=1 Tax=Botryotinia convoluta TaxID=54673 RepID=A0A4Z1HBB7_9HELO|nr:hypothetical protein BCON_0649g00020 [Botryotinia convoluta]
MTYYGDHAPKITIAVITLMIIAYVVFGLRVYTRLRNKAWGMDDWCMTTAVIPFTALTIACLGGSFRGVGVHESRMTPEQKAVGLKYFFFFEIFYCAAIIPIKLSISFMLMRIATGRRVYINSIYAMSAIFTIMNLIAFLYIIFQCSPVQYAWNTFIVGKCNPAKTLADIYYATTAVNIVTDWFCAILPIPLLWNVQLNRNAKLSVGFILGLGALASLSACIRLVYTVNLTNSHDYLFGVSDVLIWGYAENGVGMIVGCISTLRPLFRRLLNLGGDSAPERTPNHHTIWPSNNVRSGGQDEEWVVLCETDDAMAKARKSHAPLRGSESKEYILGSGIEITKTVLHDFTYPRGESKLVSRGS